MRISDGISELSVYSPGSVKRQGKMYIWPFYNAGAVSGIRPVIGRTESNALYVKPDYDQHRDLLSYNPRKHDVQYTSMGSVSIKGTPYTLPGTFFNALA